MNVHSGHRARLKERYLEHGLNSFSDLNALELLLFYVVPRHDTNPIAHALLQRFGSLDAVFSASRQELMTVPGVGEQTAAFITMLPEFFRKVEISKTKDISILNCASKAGEYLMPRFKNENEEVVILVCMDSRRQVISCQEVGRGVVNSVSVNSRKIMEMALFNRADSVILAHNHPMGYALPSIEDRRLTMELKRLLHGIGVELTDHIIVGENDFVSMAESGLMHL